MFHGSVQDLSVRGFFIAAGLEAGRKRDSLAWFGSGLGMYIHSGLVRLLASLVILYEHIYGSPSMVI